VQVQQVQQVLVDNLINISNDGIDTVTLTPSYTNPPISPLSVTVSVKTADGIQTITISMDSTSPSFLGHPDINGDIAKIYSAVIKGITPSSDNNYNYKF
jgi:hypothetical protein